MSCNWKTERP